jgi:hypothetical protein
MASLRSNLPDALIAFDVGTLKEQPGYDLAKAGDNDAAFTIAKNTVTPEFLTRLRESIGTEKPILVPVLSVEATGKNKIPAAVSAVIADALGLEVAKDIVQSNSPKRTAMNGLDRIFSPPEFSGPVKQGATHFLIDDTITQGATFASLARHIRKNGGEVVGVAAMTGKSYSAKVAPAPEVVGKLREKFGDLEEKFKSLTGNSFEDLTQSEARYLANYKPPKDISERIFKDHAHWSQMDRAHRSREDAQLTALSARSVALLVGESNTKDPLPKPGA